MLGIIGDVMYEIFETDKFDKKVKKVFNKLATKALIKIRQKLHPVLKINPYYGTCIKKLKGCDDDIYRYRLGSYRVFYIIDEDKKVVQLINIDHRKDCY